MTDQPTLTGGDLLEGQTVAIKGPAMMPIANQAETAELKLLERVLTDPAINVDKLERILALQKQHREELAEKRFNSAMVDCQAAMGAVRADASNPQTHSRYATYGALDTALRPHYNAHGFGLSFNTVDSPLDQHVRVVCYVTHREGHSRTYQIDIPTDGKGPQGKDVMSKTHAVGAGVAYGCRYLLKAIWNVIVGEYDRDGNDEPAEIPASPDGFDEWLEAITADATDGWEAFKVGWNGSPQANRQYLEQHHGELLASLKKTAAKNRGPA
ncbi:MAG: hypothetical protein QGI10_00110 [Vicinamibacterales bacterium]|nr:hypothetical protein [Vicinamibacterales bacterium]MDP7477650.1 hypothetical protein [Vicinamibacterales bacterium]